MAQISLESIERIEKTRNVLHEKVHTTYTVFEKDGQKYVQLDTYGKDDRDNPEKISQSIQFDEETAKWIVSLLCNELSLKFVIEKNWFSGGKYDS